MLDAIRRVQQRHAAMEFSAPRQSAADRNVPRTGSREQRSHRDCRPQIRQPGSRTGDFIFGGGIRRGPQPREALSRLHKTRQRYGAAGGCRRATPRKRGLLKGVEGAASIKAHSGELRGPSRSCGPGRSGFLGRVLIVAETSSSERRSRSAAARNAQVAWRGRGRGSRNPRTYRQGRRRVVATPC